MNKEEILKEYLGNQDADQKYNKLGLNCNPFPRSGTANINDNDARSFQLLPINDNVLETVSKFISRSLAKNPSNPSDKFQSCVIQGDYGTGKTQLLLFIRGFLREIANNSSYQVKPYVIYIDNPGVNLLEFLGNIISKIGHENLKKYLWNDIIDCIKSKIEYRDKLNQYVSGQISIFPSIENLDPFAEENIVSYKKFLSIFTNQIARTEKRRQFDKDLYEILNEILYEFTGDAVVANYFYEFLSNDYGINKAWEGLINGTLKQLSGKEAGIINYIVKLVKNDGFTDFFILVDEFEDITEGRLTKGQVDNYVYNLRTLLDEHREWALFFSMNPLAFKKLRMVSPPLADRIGTYTITLTGLDDESSVKLIKNYITIGGGNGYEPFTKEAILYLMELVDSNVRRFLTNCFILIEEASQEFVSNNEKIDKKFIESHIRIAGE